MRWGSVVLCLVWAGWSLPAHASLDIAAGCRSDRDCAPYPDNPWCDPNGFCWSCHDDTECIGADEICVSGACVTPCIEDLDCDASQPTCDAEQGQCVECSTNDECSASEYCTGNFCLDDACAPGERVCSNDVVRECRADGSGYDTQENCADAGGTCVEGEGGAACSGSSGSGSGDDAASDGGSEGEGGGSTSDADAGDGGGGGTTGGGETGTAGGDAGDGGGDGGITGRGCTIGTTPIDTVWLWLPLATLGLAGARRRRC